MRITKERSMFPFMYEEIAKQHQTELLNDVKAMARAKRLAKDRSQPDPRAGLRGRVGQFRLAVEAPFARLRTALTRPGWGQGQSQQHHSAVQVEHRRMYQSHETAIRQVAGGMIIFDEAHPITREMPAMTMLRAAPGEGAIMPGHTDETLIIDAAHGSSATATLIHPCEQSPN
jgi:hypothetical protein